MHCAPDVHALLDRYSLFTVVLLSHSQKWNDEGTHHAIHDSVLRPLLAAADECWAYGLSENSETFVAATDILTKERHRYRVSLAGDPVAGRERFWNAHGGKRGTIAIAVPVERFHADTLFPHCRGSFIFTNYRAGHTAAAIGYAQRKIEAQTHLVVCLPRNNGLEWMDVFAPKPLVFSLFAKAQELCHERET